MGDTKDFLRFTVGDHSVCQLRLSMLAYSSCNCADLSIRSIHALPGCNTQGLVCNIDANPWMHPTSHGVVEHVNHLEQFQGVADQMVCR